ncbi:hypothetical protein BDP27DRAFT_1430582 [Rhodocollybia butyracea]|uniref:Retroviral polymerase SH3-like domain-containing protein n=1 Tax=Rhodocollybia butyracea TaxID=206335 RepID=A0A9P5TY12_9AGAR|nr:hypothetical protein BDP27DRAFT_1430582 [Rhodocollybia butyracea]
MKLQPHGESGIVVGYACDLKGYLIYFPHSKSICSRCDVVFHGFPIPPTSPPTLETLWKDLPLLLEPRFQDDDDRLVIEQNPSSPNQINDSLSSLHRENSISRETAGPDLSSHRRENSLSRESTGHDISHPSQDIIMQDNDTPLAQRQARWTSHLPACYIIDSAADCNILLDFLQSKEDEMELECTQSEFPHLTQAFIKAEVTYANAALTEPIDDISAKDPDMLQEAKSSMYWIYWLAAIYEELESLKAKGVYKEIEHP